MLTNVQQQFMTLWKKQSLGKQITMAALVLSMLILTPVLVSWANTPSYSVAYTGLSRRPATAIPLFFLVYRCFYFHCRVRMDGLDGCRKAVQENYFPEFADCANVGSDLLDGVVGSLERGHGMARVEGLFRRARVVCDRAGDVLADHDGPDSKSRAAVVGHAVQAEFQCIQRLVGINRRLDVSDKFEIVLRGRYGHLFSVLDLGGRHFGVFRREKMGQGQIGAGDQPG